MKSGVARDKQSDNEKGCEQASSLDGLLFLIIYDLLFNLVFIWQFTVCPSLCKKNMFTCYIPVALVEFK